MSDKLTDEQVRAMIPQGASLYVVVQGSGLALALRELLDRRAKTPLYTATTDELGNTVVLRRVDDVVEQLRARVAELEAANARLRVHDVRVEGGAIVGLGELLEGED